MDGVKDQVSEQKMLLAFLSLRKLKGHLGALCQEQRQGYDFYFMVYFSIILHFGFSAKSITNKCYKKCSSPLEHNRRS